ncbi:helix-turn-helix domain-containing protein [Gloeobacter kilaueensis]|uniref:Ribonuclease E n=1 Tax=Gloeobacter kilaueensis (strain ATCC BAA-2537 / CCAP 1431/1 / ULC 316 / JS1) TaxID=1183438 RepID=U5QFK7_GLOK1|nr:helix-turn-helix domain-containing protein [Gloeobacter kilaueensis]AGY57752.1 ribonuclease E [Gloeobacter kilaueensis JS1]
MARAKLTEQEKQEILRLYRETSITTTRLADQFGVSTSTVSRLLRSELSEEEYASLSANRRTARSEEAAPAAAIERTDGTSQPELEIEATDPTPEPEPEAASPALAAIEAPPPSAPPDEVPVAEIAPEVRSEELVATTLPEPEAALSPEPDGEASRRRRRRSAPPPPPVPEPEPEPVAVEPVEEPAIAIVEAPPLLAMELPLVPAEPEVAEAVVLPPPVEESQPQPVRSRILKKSDLARMNPPPAAPVPSQYAELEAEFAQSANRIAGEEFDDEDDFEEEEEDDGIPLEPEPVAAGPAVPIEVLPFVEAAFPRICWVVVDRASELMTRPLRDFNNIGTIPDTEREAITLPIFENQRVARRFSSHYHRPLRLPVHLLSSTRQYLLRKGITRLLVGKQVYSLDQNAGLDIDAESAAFNGSEPEQEEF